MARGWRRRRAEGDEKAGMVVVAVQENEWRAINTGFQFQFPRHTFGLRHFLSGEVHNPIIVISKFYVLFMLS